MRVQTNIVILALATVVTLGAPSPSNAVVIIISKPNSKHAIMEGGKFHVRGAVDNANTMEFDKDTHTYKSISINATGVDLYLIYQQRKPDPPNNDEGSIPIQLDESDGVTFETSQTPTGIARYNGYLQANPPSPELGTTTAEGTTWVLAEATLDPGSPLDPQVVGSCRKVVNLKWRSPPAGPPSGK